MQIDSMKILQTIREYNNLYIFTENPEKDLEYFLDKYNSGLSKIHLWYDLPILEKYEFLWVEYSCIWLWYDNEYDVIKDSQDDFNNIIKKWK